MLTSLLVTVPNIVSIPVSCDYGFLAIPAFLAFIGMIFVSLSTRTFWWRSLLLTGSLFSVLSAC